MLGFIGRERDLSHTLRSRLMKDSDDERISEEMTAQDWRDRAEHLEELEFKEEGRIRIWKDEDQHDT